MSVTVVGTDIREVLVIAPRVFADDRGYFMEAYNRRSFADIGLQQTFVQDNHSHSAHNVIRGLHYQLRQPQGKLVRVVAGRIWDVAVDLRKSSSTFGRWVGVELSSEDKKMLWIPEGFAHGFIVLSESADVLYKATDFYDPTDEHTILWHDPQLAIAWPIQGEVIVSPKDQSGTTLAQAEVFA